MKIKEKYIKEPFRPLEPRKPEEFFAVTKFVCHLFDDDEERLEFSELLRRIEHSVRDKDTTKLIVVRKAEYGYYDEPDRSSIEIHEKVQQKNARYKAELKAYEKSLKKFKLDTIEYARLKKLFDTQEVKKDLRKLEIELEEIKSDRAAKALEKQKVETLEKLNKLMGEEDAATQD